MIGTSKLYITMTNEEKAMDIGDKWEHSHDSYVAENAALEMAAWMKERMIEFLNHTNFRYYVESEYRDVPCNEELIEAFKRFMS